MAIGVLGRPPGRQCGRRPCGGCQLEWAGGGEGEGVGSRHLNALRARSGRWPWRWGGPMRAFGGQGCLQWGDCFGRSATLWCATCRARRGPSRCQGPSRSKRGAGCGSCLVALWGTKSLLLTCGLVSVVAAAGVLRCPELTYLIPRPNRPRACNRDGCARRAGSVGPGPRLTATAADRPPSGIDCSILALAAREEWRRDSLLPGTPLSLARQSSSVLPPSLATCRVPAPDPRS